jgi:ABC-2 type transport system permease protein
MSWSTNFVLTPLSYLGGVFYSVEMLPGIWQSISLANPILYMVNAFRYGFIGVTDVNIQFAFLITGAFIIILTGLSLFMLYKGVGIKN